MRSTYDNLPDIAAKRGFTSALATMADFLRYGWQADAGKPALASPGAKPLHDPEAAFCFEAMRALRHDITVGPLARFYDAANGVEGSATTLRYEGAIKAMTAFSMMWRAAKGGTANIDGRYRALMSGGQDVAHPLARRDAAGAPNAIPTLSAGAGRVLGHAEARASGYLRPLGCGSCTTPGLRRRRARGPLPTAGRNAQLGDRGGDRI